jgi:hypothetical protein
MLVKTLMRFLAVVLLASIACDVAPGVAGPFGPTPVTPSWYGTITGVSTLAYGRTTSAPNLVSTEDHTLVVTIHSRVTKEGVRTQTIKGTIHDYDTHDVTTPCFRQYSTSLTDGTAPEKPLPSAADLPGLPPGVVVPGLPTGYFALNVDEAGGYVFSDGTPMPALTGTGTIETETTNHVSYETCDGGRNDSSENPSTGPIGASIPLDRLKGTVSKDGKSAVGEATWRDGDTTYLLKWSLKKAKELEADAGGPYVVERGQKVNLDASRSRGDIEKYVWTMTPRGSDCKDTSTVVGLEVGQRFEHEGKTYSFTALCDVDLELVVHGKNGAEDTDNSAEVNVRARKWRTEYQPPEKVAVDINPLFGGTNQCAFEAVSTSNGQYLRSGHYIHFDSDSYEVRHVDDPDGPFANAFYLAGHTLKMRRREVHETAYIGPNGTAFVGTEAPFNAQVAAQILAHESAHTQLLETALKRDKGKRDPAQRIEKMASPDETRLRAAAGESLTSSNRDLCKATQHPYVFSMLTAYAGKSGTIKDSSGNIIAVVPNLQTLAQDNVSCE